MPIHKAIHKYGSENFQLEILEECNIEDLDCRETFYINKYNSRDRAIGYNLLEGGNKGPTMKGIDNPKSVLSEEIVSKIRYLYLEGYVRKQAYAIINSTYNININTFYDVWNGKTYKNICYYVYDNIYKESIKEFRSINKETVYNGSKNVFKLKWKKGKDGSYTEANDSDAYIINTAIKIYNQMCDMYYYYIKKLYKAADLAIEEVINKRS
jgi:hypothetical protein